MVVTTVEELTALGACTNLGGDLRIEGPAITSLAALVHLGLIAGDLIFVDTALTDEALEALVGLPGVGANVDVGGDVVLVGSNPGLRPCDVADVLEDPLPAARVVDATGNRLDGNCE
jgi:hypothetical protein